MKFDMSNYGYFIHTTEFECGGFIILGHMTSQSYPFHSLRHTLSNGITTSGLNNGGSKTGVINVSTTPYYQIL